MSNISIIQCSVRMDGSRPYIEIRHALFISEQAKDLYIKYIHNNVFPNLGMDLLRYHATHSHTVSAVTIYEGTAKGSFVYEEFLRDLVDYEAEIPELEAMLTEDYRRWIEEGFSIWQGES